MNSELKYSKIKQLEIKSTLIAQSQLAGAYKSAFKGVGLDYSQSRVFEEGDDYRRIDSRLTARNHQIYTKTFDEERLLNVILLVDVSGSMQCGNAGSSNAELSAEAAAIIAGAAHFNGDKVGFITFDESIIDATPPSQRIDNIPKMLKHILDANSNGSTNIAVALQKLLYIIQERAIVFILSDFQSQNFKKELAVASKKFDIILLHLRESIEVDSSMSGFVNFIDSETKSRKVAHLGKNFEYRDARGELEMISKELNIDLVSFSTADELIANLINLMNERTRRKV